MRYIPMALLLGLIYHSTVWANDVAICDPSHPLVPNAVTRYEQTVDVVPRTGFLVWVAPNNSMSAQEQSRMNSLRGQFDALTGVPTRYWICTDTNPVDGVLDAVREMTQAEKDTVDAPQRQAEQRQATLTTERATLEAEVDATESTWASLTNAQRLDALRKAMRLLRVYRQAEGRD